MAFTAFYKLQRHRIHLLILIFWKYPRKGLYAQIEDAAKMRTIAYATVFNRLVHT